MAWRDGHKINENYSHSLFFEASGDSEVSDSSIIVGDIQGHDDDAESCTSFEYPNHDNHKLNFREFEDDNDGDHVHKKDDYNGTNHEDMYCNDCKRRMTDRMIGLSTGSFVLINKKEEEEEEVDSRFCVNESTRVDTSIRDDFDEMERNKLFWETCLQVGYP